MQTVARQSSRAAVARPARVARVGAVRVVAKVSAADLAKKASIAATTLPAMLAASPAFALVDERMNGDGTGLPFGINDGVLGWSMAAVAGLVWTIFYISQKDLGDFDDVEAGLQIEDRD